jgi:hypothetical protein
MGWVERGDGSKMGLEKVLQVGYSSNIIYKLCLGYDVE